MFEITYGDRAVLEQFKSAGCAYKQGVYDFTFESRYIIYHTNLRKQTDYIALNKNTGYASTVLTQKVGHLYPREAHKNLINHILYAIKYTGDRRCFSPVAENPLDMIDSIFRCILPANGYSVREEQISLSKTMYKAFSQNKIALCEAEVGTGKTLAYLVAAIVAKNNQVLYASSGPITVTTSSIELQTEIVEKVIPALSHILWTYHIIEKPLTAILRKGQEHYFCQARYRDYLDSLRRHPQKNSEAIALLEQMERNGFPFDLDKHRISNKIKDRICVKGACGGCRYAGACKYRQYGYMVCRTTNLDFQVTNHNMYLVSQKLRQENSPCLLRASPYVLIDEAHKFQEAAVTVFGEKLHESDIPDYISVIRYQCANKSWQDRYKEMVRSALSDCRALFRSLAHMVKRESTNAKESAAYFPVRLTAYQHQKIMDLSKWLVCLEKMKRRERYGCSADGRPLLAALKTFSQNSRNTMWVETDENEAITLCSTPNAVSRLLREKIWLPGISYVLTSGTMTDGTDFRYFKAENGLDQIGDCRLLESRTASPFDYGSHARLFTPYGMPFPANEGEDNQLYLAAVAEKILELIDATHGHTAILFTSYRVLQSIYELTVDKLSEYSVICMARGNKTAIADFKKAKNAILFAAGSMWEGVDCPGDRLSSVIIVRLPFPMRTAVTDKEKIKCGSVHDFVDQFAVPQMLIKLRQGVGRLIRTECDTGVVSILDPRVHSPVYKQRIDRALNKFPAVHTVDEVAEFIDSVKEDEYKNFL